MDCVQVSPWRIQSPECHATGGVRRREFWVGEALHLRVLRRACREAGGRVTLNVRVSDLDLPPRGAHDQRRLEVVADGLPLFHGAQLAIDTTMVSPARGDAGQPTVRKSGRGRARACETTQRDHVSGTLRRQRPCPFGGPCLRSRRPGRNRLWVIVIRPTLAKPTVAKPTVAKPTVAKPTLAKPTLAKVKVLVVCEDFGF